MSPGGVPEWNQDYYTNYTTIGYSALRRSPTFVYQSGLHSGLTFLWGGGSSVLGVGMWACVLTYTRAPLQLYMLILHPHLFT